MASYTHVGALKLIVSPSLRSVGPFDSNSCEFKVLATLDVADLMSGACQALKAINNVDTYFHPMQFAFSLLGSSQTFNADQTRGNDVFDFGLEKRDGQKGISLPLTVLVPRWMWPANPGEVAQFSIRAHVVVEFVHRAQGNLVEPVSRTAEATCTVRCQ